MITSNRLVFSALASLLLPPAALAQDQYEEAIAYAPVEGGQIEYVISRPEDAETIVFIHGGGLADAFLPIMQEPVLADFRKVRVHRMNFMGSFGREAQTGYSADAAHIMGVLDALGVEQAHLVWHSAGGYAAHLAAYMFPDRVSSLVIAEGSAVIWDQELRLRNGVDLGVLSEGAPSPSPEDFERQDALYEAGHREAALGMTFSDAFGEDWRDFFNSVPNGLQQAVADWGREEAFAQPAPWADINVMDILQPTLVLWGADGPPFRAALATISAEILPNAQAVAIEGGDHALIVQKPGEIARLIAEHVAENE